MAISGNYEQQVLSKPLLQRSVWIGFTWNRTSFSIEDNTSTISWELYVKLDKGYKTMSFNNTPISITIDRTQSTHIYNQTIEKDKEITTHILVSGTSVINHNLDGTKTFSYYIIIDDGNLDWTLSNVGELDALLRPATLLTAEDFNDEGNPVITYSNPSGEALDALDACISFTGAEDNIPYRPIQKTKDKYTFTLLENERKILRRAITTGNNMTVRFYLRTTIGEYVKYEYITKTFTLVNYMPTLSPSVADTNPTTAMLTGDTNKMVRYYSTANIVFGAEAHKQASLVVKNATNGSQSINIEDATVDSVTISNIDDNVFTLSATDSRGYTTSEQVHFKGDNFIPYFRVTCNQTIRLNLDSTVALTVKGKYYNGSFGAKNNELTIETRHKEDNGEWSEWESITPLISEIENGAYLLTATISGYDASGSHTFQCRAIDKLSSAESATDTITLKPIFDWGKYDFNFNVPLTIEGNALDDFVIETGSSAMGTNGTWYWRKWKNGRAECYGCRNFGNMAATTAWGGLYRSSTFTQDLPSSLFVATPEVIDISFRSTGNYGGWIIRHEESAPSASNTGSFAVVRPASATISQAYISFNIIGRWK